MDVGKEYMDVSAELLRLSRAFREAEQRWQRFTRQFLSSFDVRMVPRPTVVIVKTPNGPVIHLVQGETLVPMSTHQVAIIDAVVEPVGMSGTDSPTNPIQEDFDARLSETSQAPSQPPSGGEVV